MGSVSLKTLAPHQQRQCHCVVSSHCPPAPAERDISFAIHTREEGGFGGGYSSHSRGKWDEKDLNRVRTCSTHLSKTAEGSPSSVRDHRHPTDTQADAHLRLVSRLSSETGEGVNKQVFVTFFWAACFGRLLCWDVSWCREKELKSPCVQEGQSKSLHRYKGWPRLANHGCVGHRWRDGEV